MKPTNKTRKARAPSPSDPPLHPRTVRAIERLFLGEPPRRKLRKLKAHLEGCEACARYHERLAMIEAVVTGTYPGPGPAAQARVEARLQTHLQEKPVRGWRRPLVWAPVGAALGACLLLWLLVWPPAGPRVLPGLRVDPLEGQSAESGSFAPVAKGAEVAHTAKVGIRVYAVRPGEQRAEMGERLMLSDLISFSYTNTDPRIAQLLLLGLQPDGRIIVYHPRWPSPVSQEISQAVVDQPLRDAIRLDANHLTGPLRLVGLFSPTPLATHEILHEIQNVIEPGWFHAPLAPLPLSEGILEHSLLLSIDELSEGD